MRTRKLLRKEIDDKELVEVVQKVQEVHRQDRDHHHPHLPHRHHRPPPLLLHPLHLKIV